MPVSNHFERIPPSPAISLLINHNCPMAARMEHWVLQAFKSMSTSLDWQ